MPCNIRKISKCSSYAKQIQLSVRRKTLRKKFLLQKRKITKKKKKTKKETKQIEQTTITLTAEPSISQYFARGDRLYFHNNGMRKMRPDKWDCLFLVIKNIELTACPIWPSNDKTSRENITKTKQKGQYLGNVFCDALVEVFNLLTHFAKLKVFLVIVSKVPLSLKQSPQF